jgi:hypothetical protein
VLGVADDDHCPALQTILNNIGFIAEAMTAETNKLREYLSDVAQELGGFEAELERLRGIKRKQIEEFDAEIADRTQVHKGLENSIKTLRDGRAAILKTLEAAAPPKAA